MDEFLSLIGVQAMKYAVRSGIALTSTYALDQYSRLLTTIDDQMLEAELAARRGVLESYLKILSPTLDLIELKSGRGNVFLQSALPIARSLHQQIITIGQDLEDVATAGIGQCRKDRRRKLPRRDIVRIRQVSCNVQSLIDRIDRDIPLLQLAVSASGETFTTSLPHTISPSRLLQASTLIVMGDSLFSQNDSKPVQIGPTFSLSLYMLFLAHVAPSQVTADGFDKTDRNMYGLGEDDRKPIWQEIIHKARVSLFRSRPDLECCQRAEEITPSDGERSPKYHYFLELVEDLDDGRVHCESANGYSSGPKTKTFCHDCVPVSNISKIFYTDKAKLLNIGDVCEQENRPILLLKRGSTATATHAHGQASESSSRFVSDGHDSFCSHRSQSPGTREDTYSKQSAASMSALGNLPKHLDPEWLAFEMFAEDENADNGEDGDDDDDDDDDGVEEDPARHGDIGTCEASTHDDLSKPEDSSNLAGCEGHSRAEERNFNDEGSEVKTSSVISESHEDVRNLASGVSTQSECSQQAEMVSREAHAPFSGIATSLSLLEMMIRIAGLQEFQQVSHLSIPDHILAFFLEETSCAGTSCSTNETVGERQHSGCESIDARQRNVM